MQGLFFCLAFPFITVILHRFASLALPIPGIPAKLTVKAVLLPAQNQANIGLIAVTLAQNPLKFVQKVLPKVLPAEKCCVFGADGEI